MIRRAAVVASGLCISTMALAGPPAKYYQEDTAAMVRLDLAAITVDNVKAAVNALITQADLDAAGTGISLEADIMSQVNQIGMMQMMTMGLTTNGANAVTIAVRPGADGTMESQPEMSVLLPANSAQGAQSIMAFIQNMAGGMGGVTIDATTEMSGDEHWVVITPPGSTAVEGDGSAARRAAITGAMKSVGENTLSIGMVPTEDMVGQMLENIPDEQGQAMISTMMKAEWMGMWLSVDATPEFGVRMSYADSELAGQVEQMYQGAMGFMMAQAAEADAQIEDVPAEFTPSAIAEKLTTWFAMEREGGVCTIKLDPSEMRALTLLAVQAGPMLRQNPMFGEFMRNFEQNMPMN